MAVFPVEPRGYRDVVPKDSVSWEMPPLQPCWCSAQSGPCCCHGGTKPWGTWPCGQSNGHGRLVCPLNGSGVWRAVVPSSFLPRGCPGRDWADFLVTGLVWGGHPAWHPQGTGCNARGCREGASMASDVPAAVPALGLPLWGDQLKQPPHPHQWTEQPFSSSHGSDKGLAGNTVCLVLPQPAPRFSPGRPPPFPGQGPAAAGGPSWSLFTGCFSSLSPRGPGKLPGGKGWPYPVSPLLSR